MEAMKEKWLTLLSPLLAVAGLAPT